MKKRSDGRYCKQILLGYKPDGKRNVKTIYGSTVKEIEKKERELRNSIEDGTFVQTSMTVAQWSTTWLGTYKDGVSYNTLQMYKNAVSNHIIPCLGKIDLQDLKSFHVQQFINSLADTPRMAQICRLTIRQIVKQAVADGLMVRDVTASIKPIKKEKKERNVLSSGELDALALAEFTEQERMFVSVLRYTGLRCGEALALTVDDVDLTAKTLDVNKNLIFKENLSEIKSPKSAAGFRKVPIPDVLLKEFKRYFSLIEGKILFPMNTGNYKTKSSFTKFWKSIIKKTKAAAATLEPPVEICFTPHIFRHTYATNLYYAGVDVKTAQYILGHSSVQMTLEVYTHLDMLRTEAAAVKVNEFFEEMLSQSKISQSRFSA